MLPVDLKQFSRSVLRSVLAFVPNIFFWRTTSYFHSSAETLPLLHTWSLGVEEQFYVVFPLLVAAVWRYGLRAVIVLTIVLALASIGLAEWAWRSGKDVAAFFLDPNARAWELMIGAAIAAASIYQPMHQRVSQQLAALLSSGGLAALVLSIVLFDDATPMPSLYGLVPTLGTGLVIAFTRPGAVVYRILSARLLVGIGLISYSAYLWHQPLFAFARLRANAEPSSLEYAALIGLTFVLAYLTWRFVEAPFRDRKVVSRQWVVRSSLWGAALIGALALFGEWSQGLNGRIPAEDRELAAMADVTAAGEYVAVEI